MEWGFGNKGTKGFGISSTEEKMGMWGLWYRRRNRMGVWSIGYSKKNVGEVYGTEERMKWGGYGTEGRMGEWGLGYIGENGGVGVRVQSGEWGCRV